MYWRKDVKFCPNHCAMESRRIRTFSRVENPRAWAATRRCWKLADKPCWQGKLNSCVKLVRRLAAGCSETRGAISRLADPPRTARRVLSKGSPIAGSSLSGTQKSAVKDFAGQCAQNKFAALVDLQKSNAHFFKNYNTPAEFFVAGR